MLDRSGPAELVASPVAPPDGAPLCVARLAHHMPELEPTGSPAARASRARSLPTPGARRATVIGAGSFGTALAVLLARGGLRPTLQAGTIEQSARLAEGRQDRASLP